MEISVVAGDIAQQDVGAVVVNLFEGVTAPGGATGAVDRAMGGAISALIADGEIKGKRGELTLVHTLGRIAPKRVLVAGLGKADSFSLDGVRSVAAESARRLSGIGVESAATIVHGAGIAGLDHKASAQALAEGVVMGMYRFDKYKSNADSEQPLKGERRGIRRVQDGCVAARMPRGSRDWRGGELLQGHGQRTGEQHDSFGNGREGTGGRAPARR